MSNGIFLFKINESNEASLISKYFLPELKEMDEKFTINSNLLNRIASKHGDINDPSTLKNELSLRFHGMKFYSVFMVEKKDENYYLTFILDSKESSEPYSITTDVMSQLISISLDKKDSVKLDIIKQILSERNELVLLIRNTEKIQKIISKQANDLLDDGNFESAQDLIKIAKEIPPKIFEAVTKGDNMFHAKNYRVAQKSYEDAANLAKKINQDSIRKLLLKMAKRAEDIPKYTKTWNNLYGQMTKFYKKIDKHVNIPYSEPLNVIDNSMIIMEALENDENIAILEELEELLMQQIENAKKMVESNKQIKELINNLAS